MAKQLSCGVLVFSEAGELLLCHLTRTPYWDLPKGLAEADEAPRDAALREVREECGLQFEAASLRDLGRFAYRPGKDLHLFATLSPRVPPDQLHCASIFRDRSGRELAEVDRFAWAAPADIHRLCAPNLARLLTRLDPGALFAGLRNG
jgi:8-oxo-dGTP pyrophosphatase MutT (NUDIX family)